MKSLFTAVIALLGCALTLPAQHFTPARKLQFAEQIIENFYVDTVNSGKVVEDAIVAMLKNLDPHSQYSNAEETRELNEPLQGNFSGIGVQFNMGTDTVYVIQTVAGGPSEKVGILAGDRIIAANDTVLAGRKLRTSEVMKHLRGPKGSEVKLTVLRKGEPKPLDFRVVRDNIPIYSVDATYMPAPGIGYIRISRFGESTAEEVRKAIKQLRKEGMKDLIIDLQDNGGGYLSAATDLAQMFLNKNDLIVFTKGEKMPAQYLRSEEEPLMKDGRIVVLVNQYSASASEIFAGAMQDHDRGLVVGRRTFGKGLVQRPFPMPDGSMIRLTVSRYYTPSGRCIQKPYNAGETEEYQLDIINRYRHGELSSADSIHQSGERFYTLKNHRTVYGGGGITPDLFVPVDTTFYSDWYRDIVARGVLNKYVVSYIDANRSQLKADYPTLAKFITRFDVDTKMLDGLRAMADADSIKFSPEGFEKSAPTIRTVIKGLIARDIFEDTSAYSRVTNKLDPVFTQGLDLITDERRYNTLLHPAD